MAATPRRWPGPARELREATGVKVREILGDLDDPATRAELIAACPDADILVNNNGGPPLQGFRRDHARGYPHGGRVQHADPDRARPGAGAGHGRTQVRPHRQHHLGFGQGADPRPRRLVGRARGLDRVPRLRGAALCPPQRDHQFDPARIVRDRPAEIRPRADGGDAEHQRGQARGRNRRRESRPGGSAIRPSSGRSAPFSPARRPDSSPVRIS